MGRSTRAGDRAVPVVILFVSQGVFNVGFYAVIPFLALTMQRDFGMGGVAVGLVLGVRTFSQQGLFLIGGVLRDRFGARNLIVVGCAVRVTGYLAFAQAADFGGFLVGAILTGLGGALFSPALESLVGAADARTAATRPMGRPTLFASLVLAGEIGAATGPLVGALLLGLGFATTVTAAAGLFALAGVALWILVPGESRQQHPQPGLAPQQIIGRRWSLAFDPRFVRFCALFSVNLLAYNQLYLGLSFEIARVDGGASALGVIFVLVSVVTIALQWPLGMWASRLGPRLSFGVGFGAIAGAFLLSAITSSLDPVPGLELLPAVAMVMLLAVGHMIVGPVALSLVPRFAGTAPLGAHYGLLATCGGLAVLTGSLVLAPIFDAGAFALAWGILAVLAVVAALTLPASLPRALDPIHPTTESTHAS